MSINGLTIEISKSCKIPGYEFSSQKYSVAISYENLPEGFDQKDVEQQVVSTGDFLSNLLNAKLNIKEREVAPIVSINGNKTPDKYMIEKPGPCTEKQINCILAKCEKAKISLDILMTKLGAIYAVSTLGSLTKIEASEIISVLARTNSINDL